VADSSGGYQVITAELTDFANYLKGTTSPAVSKAAGDVHADNGFDNNAFGIFAAQILAIPARIAMGIVAGNLDKLSKEVDDVAQRTSQAARTYDEHEHTTSQNLQTFHQELS